MAEVVVSALVGVLIEKLVSGALMKFAQSQGIDSQLKKWKTTLPMIQAVLADAAQKEITQKPVEVWLVELQELAYDIEDVLDDVETEAMKQNLQQSKVLKKITSLTPHNIMYGRNIRSRLDEITTRLHDLFEQTKFLRLNQVTGETSSRTNKRLEETSLLPDDVSEILGREGDKEALLAKLLADEAKKNVSIVSIVGMGGVGKTTLARLLYNDQKVKDHFEVRAWVCVSDDIDVFSICNQIYQDVGGENKDFSNLNQLQITLKEELSKKRFLLVLDDVWNEDHKKWEALKRPLKGAAGSKVIVTTRSTKVASLINSVELYNLGILSEELAMSLFAQYALDEPNFDKHPSLELIAQDIVNKCGGLPLALVTLGRVLKIKGSDDVEWENLLKSEIWSSEDESDILPALKLSYYHLPSHLKQIFAYCSLYPKDHQFDKNKLVLKWMAQGFLSQPKGNNQPMESLGSQYFEDLRLRCFFQPSTNDKFRYTMHDLMHDLSISVAGKFFLMLDDKVGTNRENEDFEKLRHFSFIGHQDPADRKLKELHRASCLRTFLPVPGVSKGVEQDPSEWGTSNKLDNVLVKLATRSQFLRVLSLTYNSITKVPKSIGNLKHLRYLNFSKTCIKQLPKQVGKLYNLQSLLVRDCDELSSLPRNLVKLKNLRHLDVTATPSLRKMPLGIGGLTSLQTLSKVIIEGRNGFKVSELKGLNDLRGELSIEGLEKVMDPSEAKDANLEQKKGLDDLELKWSNAFDAFRNPTIEYDVLEKLRPHSKLKTLSIDGYGGMRFPSWRGDPSFDQLIELKLISCGNCTELATLGNLTSLEKLEVKECLKLVSIKGAGSSIMGSLRDVKIEKCDSLESYCCPNSVEKLEVWKCSKLVSIKGVGSSIMPSLRQVEIFYCDSLESYTCPNSVERLEVWSCPNLVSIKGGEKEVGSSIMPSLKEVTLWDCDSLESYCSPNSVEKLEIEYCSSMTSLSFSKVQEEDRPSSSSSSNLKFLKIRYCNNLKSISEEHLKSLTSLEEMRIIQCPKMEDSFPSSGLLRGLQNLRKLWIGELKKPMSEWGLQYYPSSLVDLTLYGMNSGVVSFGVKQEDQNNMTNSTTCFLLPPSLEMLDIRDFEEVESVSEVLQHLPHLQYLEIYNCPKLRDVPQSTSYLEVYMSN